MKKEELNSQTLYVVLALDFFFKIREKMDAGE